MSDQKTPWPSEGMKLRHVTRRQYKVEQVLPSTNGSKRQSFNLRTVSFRFRNLLTSPNLGIQANLPSRIAHSDANLTGAITSIRPSSTLVRNRKC